MLVSLGLELAIQMTYVGSVSEVPITPPAEDSSAVAWRVRLRGSRFSLCFNR